MSHEIEKPDGQLTWGDITSEQREMLKGVITDVMSGAKRYMSAENPSYVSFVNSNGFSENYYSSYNTSTSTRDFTDMRPEYVRATSINSYTDNNKIESHFRLNKPVKLPTFRTVFDDGVGEKMDSMYQFFEGEEPLELLYAHTLLNASGVFYRFRIATEDKYTDISETQALHDISGFEEFLHGYGIWKLEEVKRAEIKKKKARAKAEKKELDDIVKNAMKDSNGFGAWS